MRRWVCTRTRSSCRRWSRRGRVGWRCGPCVGQGNFGHLWPEWAFVSGSFGVPRAFRCDAGLYSKICMRTRLPRRGFSFTGTGPLQNEGRLWPKGRLFPACVSAGAPRSAWGCLCSGDRSLAVVFAPPRAGVSPLCQLLKVPHECKYGWRRINPCDPASRKMRSF